MGSGGMNQDFHSSSFIYHTGCCDLVTVTKKEKLQKVADFSVIKRAIVISDAGP